jgi:hypothetical protein
VNADFRIFSISHFTIFFVHPRLGYGKVVRPPPRRRFFDDVFQTCRQAPRSRHGEAAADHQGR